MSEFLSVNEIADIIDRKREKFIGLIRRNCRDLIDAEDCYGDTCVQILQNEKIKREGYPETYIGNLFIWRSIDWARRNGKNPEVSESFTLGDKEFSVLDRQHDDSTVTDKAIQLKEKELEIESLFGVFSKAGLTEQEEKILRLKYLDELKIKEIAELESIPEGSVKAIIFRSIDKCRIYIDDNDIKASFLKRMPTGYGDDLPKGGFTKTEISYVKSNWGEKKRAQILKYINLRRNEPISLSKLKALARSLGLRSTAPRKVDNLLPREIDYIRDNYLNKSDSKIAHILSHKPGKSREFTNHVIWNIRNELGLVRSKEDNERIKKKNTTYSGGVRDSMGRFVDRGLKKTRAKKIVYDFGHISLVNEKRASGDIKRARIKVNGRWKYYSNYVWELKNGKVPDGFKLMYKDRNPDESDISRVRVENMELVSLKDIALETVKGKTKPIGYIVQKEIYGRVKKDKSRTLLKKQFFIKISEKLYIPLMYYKWKEVHGEIPSGYRVRYKGGDQNEETLDKVNVENMELIQDRYSLRKTEAL